MRKNILFISFLVGCFIPSAAQNNKSKISGSVQDANGKPLSSISVSLVNAGDTSLLNKATITGKDGKYEFENIEQ